MLTKRVLACTSCFEPVLTSAWEGSVSMRCSRCGTEDVRSLRLGSPQEATEHPYRASARPEPAATPLVAEIPSLEQEPAGLAGMSPHLPTGGYDDWKRAVSRAPREGELAEDASWERVWLAAWVSTILATKAEHVRARMVLEATLETSTAPAHRALLLARLAQHAAGLGAPRLARKWLRAFPPLRSGSIAREKAVARALIALADGKHAQACVLTGDRDPGKGFTGATVGLAIAIHMEAMERRGRPEDASDLFHQLARNHCVDSIAGAVAAYGLGRTTLARTTRVAGRAELSVLVLITMGVVGMFGMTRATLLGTVLGALGAATAQALLILLARTIPWWRWFSRTWRHRLHVATVFIITTACIGIAGQVMPARERPYALVRQEPSASPSVTAPGLEEPGVEEPGVDARELGVIGDAKRGIVRAPGPVFESMSPDDEEEPRGPLDPAAARRDE